MRYTLKSFYSFFVVLLGRQIIVQIVEGSDLLRSSRAGLGDDLPGGFHQFPSLFIDVQEKILSSLVEEESCIFSLKH